MDILTPVCVSDDVSKRELKVQLASSHLPVSGHLILF